MHRRDLKKEFAGPLSLITAHRDVRVRIGKKYGGEFQIPGMLGHPGRSKNVGEINSCVDPFVTCISKRKMVMCVEE